MNGIRFDALARQAGTIDRMTSLKVLGGSLAAVAVAGPLAADAKNKNKKCKKKIEKKCEKQEQPCRDYWGNICGELQECRDFFFACCDDLANCNASQYFECVALAPDN
jgi:hypothetical protein